MKLVSFPNRNKHCDVFHLDHYGSLEKHHKIKKYISKNVDSFTMIPSEMQAIKLF